MAQHAFQDSLPGNHCFGCGPENKEGLQIKSHWVADADGPETICNWQPAAHHLAGPTHILNGGIIATILDCHSIFTAIAHAYREEKREIGSQPDIWFATGSMHVTYLRPTPVDKPVELRAHVEKADGKQVTVLSSLHSDGKERARAEVVAVRVPQSWRQRSDHAMHSE